MIYLSLHNKAAPGNTRGCNKLFDIEDMCNVPCVVRRVKMRCRLENSGFPPLDFLSLFLFWGGPVMLSGEKSHAINEQTHQVFYKLVSKQVNMENMTKKTQESIGRVNPVEAKHTVTR